MRRAVFQLGIFIFLNIYGYSALSRIDEKTIGILYEGTRDLYFVKVPVSELLK